MLRRKNVFQKLAGLWLVAEVVNRVGLYGSKVAGGCSAFQRRSCLINECNVHNQHEIKSHPWLHIGTDVVIDSLFILWRRKGQCLLPNKFGLVRNILLIGVCLVVMAIPLRAGRGDIYIYIYIYIQYHSAEMAQMAEHNIEEIAIHKNVSDGCDMSDSDFSNNIEENTNIQQC